MSLAHDLYTGETDFNFPRAWRVGMALSALLLVLAVGSLVTQGLNRGIDFEGGVAWEFPSNGVSAAAVEDALPVAAEKVQRVGSDRIRVQTAALDEDDRVAAQRTTEVTKALAELVGTDANEISVSTVGPSWGSAITEKAIRALVLFFIAIAIYISIRLEWKMAVGALVAVLHDVVISVGVYSIFQWEVTPATVISFLTILGYSLYDTIVVFDKVRENRTLVGSTAGHTYSSMVSLSMNQVLMRSLNTTLTALLPVISMLVVGSWIMGAVTLEEFSLALLVGLLCGAYSSIFIAAPVVVWLKEREPRNREVRARMASRPTTGRATTRGARAAATADLSDTEHIGDGSLAKPSGATRTAAPTPTSTATVIPPRPRKKPGKR